MSQSSSEFARGYLTLGYLLGDKDTSLPAGVTASPKLVELRERLSSPDQGERARALAIELTAICNILKSGTLT